MPTKRFSLTSSVVNNVIYVIGGTTLGNNGVGLWLNTNEAYFPSTN